LLSLVNVVVYKGERRVHQEGSPRVPYIEADVLAEIEAAEAAVGTEAAEELWDAIAATDTETAVVA